MSCMITAKRQFASFVKKFGKGFLAFSFSSIAIASSALAEEKYAAIVVDGNTGKILYSRNAEVKRYPASLTKIMTLYILFDYMQKGRIDYDTKFYVTPHAASQPPSRLGLKPGAYIRVKDIVGALVTKSANDAAAAVAENIAGSEEKFARLMTARARSLGMMETTFKNASGLPDPNQRTTALDMAKLSMRIMNDFPKYAQFFKTRYYSYDGRSFRNHNGLLFTYRGIEGIKTGYTRASGFNLTTSVRRGNKHLIAVVMGGKTAKSRNAHMAALLNKHMPVATAMSKKRPLAQRLASLDPDTVTTNTSYSAPVKKVGWKEKEAVAKASAQPADSDIAQKPFQPAKFSQKYVSGGYDIQVGAYQDRNVAVEKLSSLQSSAGNILNGHNPYIMEFQKDGVSYHRARFAGFSSRGGAMNVCSSLKKKYRVNCIVMTP